jgi:alkylation response protein AidB-like acyl-CoA dehydrogenase
VRRPAPGSNDRHRTIPAKEARRYDPGAAMDLTFSPAEEQFRAECRDWLAEHIPRPALPSGDTREGFASHLEWERTLFDAQYAVVSWPREYGGREASLWEWLIFEEEYYAAGAPQRVTQNGIFLLAPTIFEFGTQEQKDRILPRMAAGEQTWCQGWSEPNAGSDLAGIQSTAQRDEAAGGWRLGGQKTWTTRGAFCTHLFGLFRSDPEAERHRGLTYFLVDLSAPGVTVRPVERLDGDEGFAEVFLDDVFVPDADVLGEPNQGWAVAMATTGSERGLTLRSPGRFLATARRLIDLARARLDADHEVDDTPGIPDDWRDRLVAAWIDAEAYRWQTFGTVTRIVDGAGTGPESSMVKVFWSELDLRLHELALDLLGPHAELLDGDDAAWMKGYEFALAGPIYAGTNEIQRNVIAERVLGLPRK